MPRRAPAPSPRRSFDVVLYGATGFVGRQTVAYFVQHAPPRLRWAVGGRHAGRLRSVLQQAGADLARVGVIEAESQDPHALHALAAQTRVVLSTAGPFALHGNGLVAACVDAQTHYCDITGETSWVKQLIDRHHAQAERQGTRIVPFCGFDSVPSDLGAWMLTREMLLRHGQPCVDVKACFSLRGGFNGGTVASALNAMEQHGHKAFGDPFLLNPPGSAPADAAAHADVHAPRHDADFDAWVGPFFMAPVNTRVVRRSAALLSAAGDRAYGAGFHYQESLRLGRGPLAALAAAGVSVGGGLGQGLMAFAPGRRLVKALAPAPGAGPSERAMNQGHFRCELFARSAAGHTLRGRVADRGDPGNRATTKMVCEAALALALDIEDDEGEGGVLTPATALGERLLRRLRAAGMTLQV